MKNLSEKQKSSSLLIVDQHMSTFEISVIHQLHTNPHKESLAQVWHSKSHQVLITKQRKQKANGHQYSFNNPDHQTSEINTLCRLPKEKGKRPIPKIKRRNQRNRLPTAKTDSSTTRSSPDHRTATHPVADVDGAA
ncbi:Uncharacterized protein FWK35_00002553 [Aphis craccivora]|uniref:Uncharacterized protein n=1 Tax=Aphis craccivora TaxID=307492 RepID=A0A6G0ZKQ0_APHCR|nr:Uncharacterized protein FWK35_00002553 [Aphis craccivora]